ncbi:hypothetical protein [Corallococcus terminator]|uniref:Tetratricopeptide repeat protein n=1 Tax=Corallococcus terminator TaxID=2316733 RepID=A0A3A8J8X4_9BACT|nr:hypothetical protein [Corallococcus terminator]RKG92152.1 hypothetical protein D7V88_07275 [Corallococcus terminator]
MELRTSGDELVGTAPAGGVCQRPAAQQVLKGSFLGNVFIGDVTLCQTGDACPESATYAVMLFYSFEERTLGGLVKMEGGCESSLLKNGMLVLRATEQGASAQPVTAVASERQVQAPASASGSAAQVAAHRRLEAVDVPAALRQGQQALAAMNALTASQQFQLVLAQEKNNALALTGMGVAHFLRDQKPEALKFLEQARSAGNQQARAEAWFWMACVKRATQESKLAQEALRRAVSEGWSAPEGNALVDRELSLLSKEGPNFDSLVKQARVRKRAQGRDSQGAGSVSP